MAVRRNLVLLLSMFLVLTYSTPVKRNKKICAYLCSKGVCPPGCPGADVIDWNKRFLGDFLDNPTMEDKMYYKWLGRDDIGDF